ncbi:hypothetical protein L6452_18627 [Arctium lappa]|uniref:Uncharacterized protein n=1 Tax=Arctium lappa TaxID=4217 RepID=A0ACB9C6V2_ARCLA|nr:hypothetical protein L6452_18627 [Arctium lappa]
MELELSLSPPYQKSTPPIIKKNFHGGDHDDRCSSTSVTRFPRVSWNHNEDEENKRFFNGEYQQDMDGDGEGLIGWPPLHSWRKRFMEDNHFEGEGEFNGRVDEEGGNINNNYNHLLFVKVKMDGVGIARKIDLNAFHSYQMLTTALIHMFDKYVENDEDGATYKLMYQHKDGHWLLAGDIPWEMFIQTVQRIQMVRN